MKNTLCSKKCLKSGKMWNAIHACLADKINEKIKASQGVEYINYGHNYTVTIKNALSVQT